VGATRRVGRVVKEQQMSNGKSPALTESSPASDTVARSNVTHEKWSQPFTRNRDH